MPDYRGVKLGKQTPRWDRRTLQFARYLTPQLPPPPPRIDYSNRAAHYGMLANDSLGDCTIAGVGHAVQVFTLNAGKEAAVTDSEVVSYYEKWCGYNPRYPSTDQGGVEIDVLNDWRQQGFGGFPLLAYAAMNPQNEMHIKQAVALFGVVYIGLALPMTAQRQTVWSLVNDHGSGDAQPGSWGGHCVVLVGYNGIGPRCITWGEVKQMTWRFAAKYMDEAYALLAKEWTPKGFSLAQLEADLRAVTG